MSRTRRAVSIVSMGSGIVLFVAGLGVRAGVVPVTNGAGPSSPTATGRPVALASAEPLATPSHEPAPSPPQPTSSPVPPTDSPEAWFADDFDAIAAWPDGPIDSLTTSIVDGHYRVQAPETDLPVFAMAAAGDAGPGSELMVSLSVTFLVHAEPSSAAGIVLADGDGTRLLAFVSADGRVSLLRDTFESLDTLASGSAEASTGPVELAVRLRDGTATLSLDGAEIASARMGLETIGVGVGTWAVGGPMTVEFDTYRVWTDR